MVKKYDPEIEQFKSDLLASVREMKCGKAVRETHIDLPQAARVRAKTVFTQKEFAAMIGVSERTLQQWEQGLREPTGAARVLLRVAERHPEVLHDLTS